MKSSNPPYTRIGIEPPLRRIILFEIIFPSVLLVLGIFTGLLQVLYRAGIIRSQSFLGLELPFSEPYHDEDIASVQRCRPWLIGAVILLIIRVHDALHRSGPRTL